MTTPWKHIAALTLWLYLMPPMGLWKLWTDSTLSSSMKWRILLYAFLLPVLAYVAYSIRSANVLLQNALP